MKLSKLGLIFGAVAFFAVVVAPTALAENTSGQSTTQLIEQLKAQIAELQTKIKALETQEQALKTAKFEVKEVKKEVRTTVKFLRQLRRGMSGEDITTLQEVLASDPEVYPEGIITGFFGSLTEKALKKFQKKHGIEQAGEVGPQTRVRLHALLDEILDRGAGASGKIPPGLLKKLGHATTTDDGDDDEDGDGEDEDEDGDDSKGNKKDKGQGEIVTICHIPPGNLAGKHTLHIGKPALEAHLKHGDTKGACVDGGGTGTTTPDVIAPVISNLIATSTTASATSITWSTNEPATSKVWYATSTPVVVGSFGVLMTGDNSLVTSHSAGLASLTATTTYYHFAVSSDAAGNTATSSTQSLVTQ